MLEAEEKDKKKKQEKERKQKEIKEKQQADRQKLSAIYEAPDDEVKEKVKAVPQKQEVQEVVKV